MTLSSIFARIRSLFVRTPAPVAPASVAPALPAWPWVADRTRGPKRTVVAHGVVFATSPQAALALLVNTGQVFAKEAVEIDGTRYRIWPNARPTPIDPAKRSRSGDRRRHREHGMNG